MAVPLCSEPPRDPLSILKVNFFLCLLRGYIAKFAKYSQGTVFCSLHCNKLMLTHGYSCNITEKVSVNLEILL